MRFLLLLSVILILGCTQSSIINDTIISNVSSGTVLSSSFSDFVMNDPVSVFSKEDIDLLGVSCQGSDLEIAECIKSWQESNMIYCSPMDFIDCADPMRFNYMLPGIYPSNEIIREKLSNDMVYGVCFTYASVYCSIAKYYGLSCRVMNSLTKPSERTGNTQGITGLGPDEYNRLKIKLAKNGYDYSYDLIRGIARETAEHYWAEVLINGAWLAFDASNKATGGNVTSEYVLTGDFEVTNWSLNDPMLQVPVNDNIFSNYPIQEEVIEDRPANDIAELLSGDYLAPYYSDCSSVCSFVDPGDFYCFEDCSESLISCYESCSGSRMFLICDFYCARSDDFSSCYLSCCGESLNVSCYDSCFSLE